MSFDERKGFGVDVQIKSNISRGENPLGGKHGDSSWETTVRMKREEQLKSGSQQADRERSHLDKYWTQANEKGIFRGGTYIIKGEEFKVSGIEVRGGRYPTVILHGGRSGFEPKEIKLDDSFWESNSKKKTENEE